MIKEISDAANAVIILAFKEGAKYSLSSLRNMAAQKGTISYFELCEMIGKAEVEANDYVRYML